MPRHLQPIQSTKHRVAAIALYRALLSRCSSAPLPDDDRAALRNAVQNRFRRSKNLQSPTMLGLNFRAGYETLDHLDAASANDTTSLGILTKLVTELPRSLKRAPRRRIYPSSSSPPRKGLACLPPEHAVLNVRPRAKTSGPRRVPILASANGVPFLRLTKPQSPTLSRVIRYRLQRKIDVFDIKIMLTNWWLPMAKQEDEWDALVNERAGRNIDGHDGDVRWADAVRLGVRVNQEDYDRDNAYDRELTRKMQRIVDRETAMALKEGQTIVRGRKKRPIRVLRPPKP